MKPITPHLWFDKEAKEAAEFYCSVFPNSRITSVKTLRNTPSGDCDVARAPTLSIESSRTIVRNRDRRRLRSPRCRTVRVAPLVKPPGFESRT